MNRHEQIDIGFERALRLVLIFILIDLFRFALRTCMWNVDKDEI